MKKPSRIILWTLLCFGQLAASEDLRVLAIDPVPHMLKSFETHGLYAEPSQQAVSSLEQQEQRAFALFCKHIKEETGCSVIRTEDNTVILHWVKPLQWNGNGGLHFAVTSFSQQAWVPESPYASHLFRYELMAAYLKAFDPYARVQMRVRMETERTRYALGVVADKQAGQWIARAVFSESSVRALGILPGSMVPKELSFPKERPFTVLKEEGTLYLRFDSFSRAHTQAFERALKQHGTAKRLCVDLRTNAGGDISAALRCLDVLLPAGQIYLRSNDGSNEYVHRSTAVQWWSQPIVILVSQQTASAAELFAGSIKATRRGVLIGSQSFGKHVIQKTFHLPDGGLCRLSVKRFYWQPEQANTILIPDYLVDNVCTASWQTLMKLAQ